MFEFDRRRTLIAIVAVILVLLLILFGGISLWRRPANGPSQGTSLPRISDAGHGPVSGGIAARNAGSTKQEVDPRLSVVRLARLFTEHFGTFSSQSNYEGITAIAPLATDQFNRWVTSQYLPGLKRANDGGAYRGQTVRVLSVDVQSLTAASSTVLVRTQRAITSRTAAPVITYPTMTLQLVTTPSGDWLVDNAVWSAAP